MALGHDVRTGGLAEGRIGAGKGADRFLFVPLGTGIAGAIGIAGRVEAGAHGFAGEIGHIVVRPGGAPCPCGQVGCLERYASAAAVSAAWATASGDPDADAADCAKAVASGDPNAVRVWRSAVDALADGLVTALTLLDPRTLIIGGGLAEAGRSCSHRCGRPSSGGSPSRNCRRLFQRPWATPPVASAPGYWPGISSLPLTAWR